MKANLRWNFRNYDEDSDSDGIDNRDDDDDDGDGIPDDDEEYHYDYDEECYRKDLEGMEPIQTKLGPLGSLVENCCEFDGYVEIDECQGTDKEVFLINKIGKGEGGVNRVQTSSEVLLWSFCPLFSSYCQ